MAIDPRNVAQRVIGAGVNEFRGKSDFAFRGAGDDGPGLNASWVRWWVGAPSMDSRDFPLTEQSSNADFDKWWADNLPLKDLAEQDAIFLRYGVHVVATFKAVPAAWLDQKHDLAPQYVEASARLAAAAVGYLAENNIKIDYVEYFNEPDGNWDTHLSPEELRAFTHKLAAELAARGLKTGVIAPGVSHIDVVSSEDREYLSRWATDPSVSALSFHAYMWRDPSNSLRDYSASLSRFVSTLRDGSNKPLFATEFAWTVKAPYRGVVYSNDAATCYDDDHSDTGKCLWLQPVYAVRDFAQLLTLLNAGVTVPFVWQASDYNWGRANAGQAWGLVSAPSRGARPRPSFYALRMIYPALASGKFSVLRVIQPKDEDLYVAALRDGRNILFAAVNEGDQPKSVTVSLDPSAGSVSKAVQFGGPQCRQTTCPLEYKLSGGGVSVVAPAHGAITLSMSAEAPPPK